MKYETVDHTKEQLNLKRWLGCGTTLIGKPNLPGQHSRFREEGNDRDPFFGKGLNLKEVKYVFFTLFFMPILPIGCYLIHSWDTIVSDFQVFQYESVDRKERASFKEIALIYLYYWMIVPICLLLVYLQAGGE